MGESTEKFLRNVQPVLPAAPWIGGKRLLADRMIERIDAIAHSTYAEPFTGMGGVFLRRTRVPKAEIINDASRDVATFFRILQRHYPQFMDTLRFQITSRAAFERLVATDPDTLTDLERAARFLYLQRLSYGGKVAGRTFGTGVARPARFNLNTLGPRLEELHERLAGITIECLDFEQFIQRYDRPETLFYCDPPYYGVEGYYGKELFVRADFERLADALKAISGRFILSLNDHADVRYIFRDFAIEAVNTVYSVSGSKQREASEVLITNLN